MNKSAQDNLPRIWSFDSVPRQAGLDRQRAYTDWVSKMSFQLIGHFTFSFDLSRKVAREKLETYFDQCESIIRAPMQCVISEEKKPSNPGEGDNRVHFHAVIKSVAPLDPDFLARTWAAPRFGGEWTNGPSAVIDKLVPSLNGVAYILKGVSDPDHTLWLRNIDLGRRTRTYATSKQERRRQRRHEQRMRSFPAVGTSPVITERRATVL